MKYYEPETVILRKDDDGKKRWYLSTREGYEGIGEEDYSTLILSTDYFNEGTVISLKEPIEDYQE
jgi:hypothetical protein